MIKIIPPGSQQLNDVIAKMVKTSSRGLVGGDLADFVKRAGHRFADEVRRMDIKPGEVPIHLIAIGAHEAYANNRNGDSFMEKVCQQYHDTFVKHARFYRNHLNKNPEKSYGYVKQSMYNEPMKRIELLVMLNATKEAADRNRGLIADEELEKLASGADIGVSMACRVPFDICGGCGHRAKNTSEYCTGEDEGGHCKRGGVKNRMCYVHDDGFVNHVQNTEPDFFDISKVWRPADRIAYVLGKAASAVITSGAMLADEMGMTLPIDLVIEHSSKYVANQIKLAYKLAELEYTIPGTYSPYDIAFDHRVQTFNDWTGPQGNYKQALSALTSEKVALPLEGLLNHVLGSETKVEGIKSAVAAYLPGVYSRLLRSPDFDKKIELNPFTMSDEPASLAVRQWATKVAADYSLKREDVQRRAWLASLRGVGMYEPFKSINVKTASDNSAAEGLATAYALYKLAFLSAVQNTDKDFDLTCELVVRQNYV